MRFSYATRTPRTKRSPTTDPIEPPMKSNSNTAITSGAERMLPCMTTSASVSPVSSSAAESRSGYFRVSLNFRLSIGRTSEPISYRPSGSRSCSMRSRAETRPWCPHLGHTLRFCSRSVRYRTVSHDGHLTQRPSGTAFLFMPGVALIRGGSNFCNQLIVFSLAALGSALGHGVDGVANRRQPRAGAGGCLLRRSALDFLDDAAADHHRVGVRGDRLRPRSVANAEADADRTRHVLAYFGKLGDDIRGVEVRRAGHSLERDVIYISAREPGNGHDARRPPGRRKKKDRGHCPFGHRRREFRRLLGRLGHDDRAVHARLAR